jgi:outer membrane protein assembly factor BamA
LKLSIVVFVLGAAFFALAQEPADSVSFLNADPPRALDTDTTTLARVDSIIVRGADITDEDVILRELTFGVGDSLDSALLAYNRERVYSLNIFTRVDLYVEKIGAQYAAVVEVKESWYIWPAPYIHRVDNDWSKLSYGLDLMWYNFRGKKEKLHFRFGVGHDPMLNFTYTIPYILREEAISANIALNYKSRANKSLRAEAAYGEQFDQDIRSVDLEVGKRFTLFQAASLLGGFFYLESERHVPGVNASDDRIDRFGYLGALYNYDTRDLSQFPTSGVFLGLGAWWKGIGAEDVNYGSVVADARAYREFFGFLIAKARFRTRQTVGADVPYYDYSFLGLSERVRGHYYDQREDRAAANWAFEANVPLVRDFPFHLPIPFVTERLTTYRLKFYAHLFADGGLTHNYDAPIEPSDVYSGFGAGVTLMVLPYNVLRFEVGFDEELNEEYILDVGVSF